MASCVVISRLSPPGWGKKSGIKTVSVLNMWPPHHHFFCLLGTRKEFTDLSSARHYPDTPPPSSAHFPSHTLSSTSLLPPAILRIPSCNFGWPPPKTRHIITPQILLRPPTPASLFGVRGLSQWGSETYDLPLVKLKISVEHKEHLKLWECEDARHEQCTLTWRQYKHDTPTGRGNSSRMATNKTWNVYVFCVWEGRWMYSLKEKWKRQSCLWSTDTAPRHSVCSLLDREGGRHSPPPPLAKDTDIEQDKTLTFHQHLSSISFSLTLSSVFDMALAFPRAAVLWQHHTAVEKK